MIPATVTLWRPRSEKSANLYGAGQCPTFGFLTLSYESLQRDQLPTHLQGS